MKTKKTYKDSSKRIILFFYLLLNVITSYSQKCDGNQIAITIENVITTSANTLEFDVYITNTGSNLLSLAAIQGAVIYNKQLVDSNSQTTFSVINEKNRANDFPQFNEMTTKFSEATNQLRWIQNPVSLLSGKTVNLPFLKKLKFASFRLTSSLPLKSNLTSILTPLYKFKPGFTNIVATIYCNSNSDSIALKPTSTALNNIAIENHIAFAVPNPYSDNFHLEIQNSNENPIQMKVYDMLGKQIENRSIEIADLQNLVLGSNYPSGIYTVSLTQAEKTQTLRIIKR